MSMFKIPQLSNFTRCNPASLDIYRGRLNSGIGNIWVCLEPWEIFNTFSKIWFKKVVSTLHQDVLKIQNSQTATDTNVKFCTFIGQKSVNIVAKARLLWAFSWFSINIKKVDLKKIPQFSNLIVNPFWKICNVRSGPSGTSKLLHPIKDTWVSEM